MAGRRVSPIDDLNLNRVFPGDPDGTVTQQIAWYIEHEITPMADIMADLHSGGSSLMYLPSALVQLGGDEERQRRQVAALKAFASPTAYFTRWGPGGAATASGGAMRKGVVAMGTELGGSGTVTPAALRIAERGIRNLLVHVGILPESERIVPPEPTRFFEVAGPDYYTYAPEPGVFEPAVELGQSVHGGQVAGRIHFPETPWASPVDVHFQRDGIVLCKRIPGRTARGDCLFHLGTPADL
jgi:predicted deacylase